MSAIRYSGMLLTLFFLLPVHGETQPPAQTDEVSAPAALAADSPARLENLRSFVSHAKFAEAYQLGTELAPYFEGDPQFDFNYGLACLETGQYNEGLFIFERLTILFPREPRYRLELARAQFYLRNLVRAEKEFKQVLSGNPPAAVKANIQRFLDEIKNLQRSVEPAFLITLDAGGGYDSNVNSATTERSIDSSELIYPFDIALNDASRETDTGFWSAMANVYYLKPTSKISFFDVRVVANTRQNSETPAYDTDVLQLESAYAINTGAVRWRAGGRYQYVQLDGEQFLDSPAAIGQIQWRMENNWSLGLGGNYGEAQYAANKDQNLTQLQGNLTLSTPPGDGAWTLTLSYGDDEAKNSQYNYLGKTSYGFNFMRSNLLGVRGSAYLSAGMNQAEYKAIQNNLYADLRRDLTSNFNFGFRYNFTPKFSVRNDYALTYNDSTLEANTYKRGKAEVGLTYSF